MKPFLLVLSLFLHGTGYASADWTAQPTDIRITLDFIDATMGKGSIVMQKMLKKT